MVASDGLYYRVLKDEYTLACVKPPAASGKFDFLTYRAVTKISD